MIASDVGRALSAFVSVLDNLGIPWMVGGSLASSIHGTARSTLDVDMVLALPAFAIGGLVSALVPEFYVDEDAVREAVSAGAGFNAIHNPTIVKLDAYILTADPFEQQAFARGVTHALPGETATEAVFRFSSAEDIVLQKLRWYRMGGEVSERQWQDVLGVLRVGGPGLDTSHLTKWAGYLGLTDLLSRALAEAGVAPRDG